MTIVDQHNRTINYMRLAVTDRCNLRCSYCMPEFGMKFLPKSAVLSFEEMLRLCEITAKIGVNSFGNHSNLQYKQILYYNFH